jgi:hypothetical protein
MWWCLVTNRPMDDPQRLAERWLSNIEDELRPLPEAHVERLKEVVEHGAERFVEEGSDPTERSTFPRDPRSVENEAVNRLHQMAGAVAQEVQRAEAQGQPAGPDVFVAAMGRFCPGFWPFC